MFNQKGFTLIEVVIGLAISVMLLSAMAGLLTSSLAQWYDSQSRMLVTQTARFATDSMVRELRYAKTVTIENDGSLLYTVLPDGKQYRLSLSPTHVLYRKDVSDSGYPQPVAGGDNDVSVQHLAFSYLGAAPGKQGICLEITVAGRGWGDHVQTSTIRTTVYPLNQ